MIIHIDGTQGSGKSYLCSKIKMKCVDTDEIIDKAYDIIEKSQKTSKKMPRTMRQIRKVSNNLIKNYIEKNKNIVFVGMTAEIPDADKKYFIKITDFNTVFKRLVLRELDKIIKSEKKIKNEVKKMDNPKINSIERVAKMSVKFPPSFMDFTNDYKERLKVAKKMGYIPKTQEQLIDLINKL